MTRFIVFFLYFLLVFNLKGVNLIPNSSFEVGSGRGWNVWRQSHNDGTPESFKMHNLSSAEALHGTKSARILNSYSAFSRQVWLTNGTYTLTFSGKAVNANTFRWTVGSVSNYLSHWSNIVLTTSWKRFTNVVVATSPVGGTTAGFYMVGFQHLQSTMTAYIDSIQLEPGGVASDYAPISTVEAGLEYTNHQYNVIFDGETKRININVWNDGAATTGYIFYDVYDLFNVNYSSGYKTLSLAANGLTTTTLDLPNRNGFHRIVTRVRDTDNSRDELTIMAMPQAALTTATTNGMLGAHSNYDTNQIPQLRSIGYSWARSLSPSGPLFRWSSVEPTEGNFTFNDSGVNIFSTNGLHAIGCLTDTDGFAPFWATNAAGVINLSAYSNYVYTMVDRYKATIKYWEIWNEPAQSGSSWIRSYTNYASLLAVGAGAVKLADPTAMVIGFGGVFDEQWATNAWNRLSAGEKAQVDIVSCHLYPNDTDSNGAGGDPNLSEFDSRFQEWKAAGIIMGKPIWNTESGVWNRGGMFTENNSFAFRPDLTFADEFDRVEELMRSRVSADRIIRTIIRSFGNNFKQFTYYDNRHFASEMVLPTHPSMWEYTDTPRPTGIAVSILGHFLEGYVTSSRITNSTPGPPLEMYLFTRGTTNILTAFNYDRVDRSLGVTNTSFTVYDIMGNIISVPSTNVIITKTPQYIVSSTLSSTQLSAIFTSAVVATLADTNAPKISINVAPSGLWSGDGMARFVWNAVDDKYSNHVGTSRSNILFAWKIDGDAYSVYSQTNHVDITTLSAGNHTFYVKAKDKENNESEASYTLQPDVSIIQRIRRILLRRGF